MSKRKIKQKAEVLYNINRIEHYNHNVYNILSNLLPKFSRKTWCVIFMFALMAAAVIVPYELRRIENKKI